MVAAMMIGPRLNQVFASRWKALFWAAGVMMTAYCSIPSADETSAAAGTDKAAGPTVPHKSPWAK